MDLQERTQSFLDKRTELNEKSKKILDKADADAEGQGLTAEDEQEWDRYADEINKLTAQIDRCNAQMERDAAMAEAVDRQLSGNTQTATTQGAGEGAIAEPFKVTTSGGHEVEIGPADVGFAQGTVQYRKAFATFLSTGHRADLQVTPDTKGGYLAPTQFSARLLQDLDNEVLMRRLATVLPPLSSGASLGIPTLDTDPGDADWSAEVPASDISDDTSMAFGKRELTPHLCTKLVKVSDKLLRASVLSVETILNARLQYKFGVTEEQAFMTGDGAQQPLGCFVASADGISTSRDTTCTGTTDFTVDELIDLFGALKYGYRDNASWVVHRDFVTRLRKKQDGESRYVWQPSIVVGEPDRLMGRPIYASEYAPSTFTTGLYIAIVGDFGRGYMIADSLGVGIQRLNELFAARNQVGFLGRKETDGMPVQENAFSRLILN
jgi:HK97 family phage major capsid protein